MMMTTTTTATARCFVAPAAAPRGLRRAAGAAPKHKSPTSLVPTVVPNANSSTSEASSTRSATPPYSGVPCVVVLGGGFGGLYTALRLDELTWPDGAKKPSVTLLDRCERFVFKPMLYELVNETMSDW
jgi:NADH:ubiquinone reductase (non-electrogenic)